MIKISATLPDLSTVVFFPKENEVEEIVSEMFSQGALIVQTTEV